MIFSNSLKAQDNKRVAKNTLLLYFRMIIIIIVSLYTVRIILNILGIIDYGIYSVVGGFVAMFSFLSNTMASATQRFIAFEIGKRNPERLKQIFSLSLLIYILIAIVVLIIAETVGVWFLNNKMTIPYDRLVATNWVYQFAIMSFIVTIISLPYYSVLIARENMKTYAIISALEVFLKLGIVFLLFLVKDDKLIFYGVFLFIVSLIISSIYKIYCTKKYIECRYNFYWNKTIFIEMTSYAAWNMIGALANLFKNQGVNVLLNVFFGPVINTARGISIQIGVALNSFVTNIYMAVRPHITKVYASGDKEYMMKIVFQSAKLSYFLILIISMPVMLETNYIINIWLGKVPDYIVLFTQLIILNILIETMNNQLVSALQAVGRIVKYQIFVSLLFILTLPVSYVFYYFGAEPEVSLYVSIVIAVISFVPQILITNLETGMSIKNYFNEVIFKMIIVSVIAYMLPIIILNNMQPGLYRFIIILTTGFISCLFSIYFLGLIKGERIVIFRYINKIIGRHVS